MSKEAKELKAKRQKEAREAYYRDTPDHVRQQRNDNIAAAKKARFSDPAYRAKYSAACRKQYYHIDDVNTLYKGRVEIAKAYSVKPTTISSWIKAGKVIKL